MIFKISVTIFRKIIKIKHLSYLTNIYCVTKSGRVNLIANFQVIQNYV